jgi:type I restriction-modification system DNA methylase subunit
MAKGLGDKHNEIKDEHITKIVELYQAFQNSEYTKVIERDDLLFDEVSTRRKFQRSYILNEETLEKIKLGTKFNDLVEKFHKDEPFDEDKDTPVIEQLAVLKELNNTILTNDQKVVVANVEKAIQQQTDIINILSKDFDHKKFVNRNTFANKIYQLLPE